MGEKGEGGKSEVNLPKRAGRGEGRTSVSLVNVEAQEGWTKDPSGGGKNSQGTGSGAGRRPLVLYGRRPSNKTVATHRTLWGISKVNSGNPMRRVTVLGGGPRKRGVKELPSGQDSFGISQKRHTWETHGLVVTNRLGGTEWSEAGRGVEKSGAGLKLSIFSRPATDTFGDGFTLAAG